MAFIVLTNGKPKTISANLAAKLYLLQTGELKGTPEEVAKAKQVARFHFNPDNPATPASWKAARAKNSGLGGRDV